MYVPIRKSSHGLAKETTDLAIPWLSINCSFAFTSKYSFPIGLPIAVDLSLSSPINHIKYILMYEIKTYDYQRIKVSKHFITWKNHETINIVYSSDVRNFSSFCQYVHVLRKVHMSMQVYSSWQLAWACQLAWHQASQGSLAAASCWGKLHSFKLQNWVEETKDIVDCGVTRY